MVDRLFKISNSISLFIFGARGTGKSYYLREHFPAEDVLFIDLLDDEVEERYRRNVAELSAIIKARRAFYYMLHPFTHLELKEQFKLNDVLQFGSLSKIFSLADKSDKAQFLKAYIKTYLKEEILQEQIIRKIDAFKNFLPIAAQMSGEILNYSKIANDVGIDDKTVENYFQILEDTLLGFKLPAFDMSLRKQQRQAPKFYLFDLGVKRALLNRMTLDVLPASSEYGKLFEESVVLECLRLNEYLQKDFEFSYYKTKGDIEIDLVVKRPGLKTLLIEIKSTNRAQEFEAKNIIGLMKDFPGQFEGIVFSNDREFKNYSEVQFYHWQDGVKKIFFVG